MADDFVPPRADVSFGDVFQAEFLHDVHLRSDAAMLGTKDMPAKAGGGLAYAPKFARNREYVLAHGAPYSAVLITDNCVIDTALGRDSGGRGPRGRLLFAPIVPASGEELHTQSFGRFPVPAIEGVPAGIVELRRCFMVDARDVAEHVNARLASMDDDLAEQLEIRWNAYAARRGPLAALRNSEKLAGLFARAAGRDEPDDLELDAAVVVAQAMAAAWRIEGHNLEAVASAFDAGAAGIGELTELAAALLELAAHAEAAAMVINERSV